MSEPPAPVVPLRAARRADGSVLLRLPRAAGLLADGVPTGPQQLLLALGPTSSLELGGIARHQLSAPDVASALAQLARAAERAVPGPRLLDQLVVSGGGPVATDLARMLRTYARAVTGPVHAPEALAAHETPDLVVSITSEALDLDWCRSWARRRVTVLPVVARGDRVIVGPLLAPDGAPCARCIELHRLDRDPHRATLLTSPDPALDDPEQLDLEPALAAMSVGVTAELVRCLGQGVRLPRATSWSMQLPYPQVHLHAWESHPRCSCQQPPR